jgi:hypothetical protein
LFDRLLSYVKSQNLSIHDKMEEKQFVNPTGSLAFLFRCLFYFIFRNLTTSANYLFISKSIYKILKCSSKVTFKMWMDDKVVNWKRVIKEWVSCQLSLIFSVHHVEFIIKITNILSGTIMVCESFLYNVHFCMSE